MSGSAHMGLVFSLMTASLLSVELGFADERVADPRIRQLVEEVWKDPPKTLDLLICRTLTRRGVSSELIRKGVEDDFDRLQKNNEQMRKAFENDPKERAARIEKTIANALSLQAKPRHTLTRVRISGDAYRQDQRFLSGGKCDAQLADWFDKTYVNTGRSSSGVCESLYYDHSGKEAHQMHRGRSPMWLREEVWQFRTIGPTNILLLRAATGKLTTHVQCDSDKVSQLASGNHRELRITVDREAQAENLSDVFRVYGSKDSRPTIIITTVAEHPELVKKVEQFNVKSGLMVRAYVMRDHDASGLPRYWKHEAVLEDGFVESDIWEVLEYAENIPIPEDVFAFATPSGYSTFVATPTQTTMRFADGRVHTSAGTEAQPKQTGKWLLMVNAIIAIVLIGRVYRRRRMARR